MKASDSYKLLIEGQKYTVEKELFENVEEGSKVIFYIGPKSEHVLKIVEKKNT